MPGKIFNWMSVDVVLKKNFCPSFFESFICHMKASLRGIIILPCFNFHMKFYCIEIHSICLVLPCHKATVTGNSSKVNVISVTVHNNLLNNTVSYVTCSYLKKRHKHFNCSFLDCKPSNFSITCNRCK